MPTEYCQKSENANTVTCEDMSWTHVNRIPHGEPVTQKQLYSPSPWCFKKLSHRNQSLELLEQYLHFLNTPKSTKPM